MGSDSDLPVMKDALDLLSSFEVATEIKIVSAHRTAQFMMAYAKTARKRGIRVIIAGAGGAAHLPGMIAALTIIPVIGVPIKTSGLNGLDSLLSIVQMPAGVPVATVAINGARNAAILACQMLAIGDRTIAAKLEKFKDSLRSEVLQKGEKLDQVGAERYINSLKK